MLLYEKDEQRPVKLKPVQYRSMSENIAANLRQSILLGDIAQGTRLTEQGLSQQLGVSRNVIREALFELMAEGLLIKERNKYTQVVELRTKDIEDVFDLRIALEQAAAKRCSGSRAAYEQLSSLSHEIYLISGEKENALELMQADIAFHTRLVELSMNKPLLQAWRECLGPIMMLLYQYIQAGFELSYSHDELLDGIVQGNTQALCQAVEEHIQGTKNALIHTKQ